MLNDKTILITGGTGSFGKKFLEMIFEKYQPKKVIIYSRDEFKQSVMQSDYRDKVDMNRVRFLLGMFVTGRGYTELLRELIMSFMQQR